MRNHILALLLFAAGLVKSHAQDSTLYYSASLSGAASTSQTPFWLQNNQNGVIPVKGSFVAARAGIFRVYNSNNPRFFQWSGGAEVVGIAGRQATVFLTDAFLAGKAGPVELSIGQQKTFSGLADSTLTSGSLALSENYRPYPKVQLSTPRFVNIIPGNDVISFKFSYSDGLLGPAGIHYGNVSRVKDIYLHHKAFYIKLGKHTHKLNVYAGFNHQVIWGGEDQIFTGGLNRSDAYEYVVFGKAWGGSRVGNHFGTIDVAAKWNGNKWNVFLYRQSIYEDGSLANLSNIADGLNGLRFKRNARKGPHAGSA